MRLSSPEPITKSHDCSEFDCGTPPLNDFLVKYALQNNNSDSAKTYVTLQDNKVVGYYSLAYGSVSIEDAPSRVKKGLPRHPIPIMLLARLAVDKSLQGKKVGAGLLRDAFLRTVQASEIAALRAMFVHAKDESAKTFYIKYGFEPSHIDEFHLYLLMKNIRHNLGLHT